MPHHFICLVGQTLGSKLHGACKHSVEGWQVIPQSQVLRKLG